LLDPSHVAWVHPGSFGNSACESETVEVKADPTGVTAFATVLRIKTTASPSK